MTSCCGSCLHRAPVEVIQVPALLAAQEEKTPIRRDEKMTLDHPLTVADLGEGEKLTPAVCQQMAGQSCCTVLRQAACT